jgi:hypothetical protein
MRKPYGVDRYFVLARNVTGIVAHGSGGAGRRAVTGRIAGPVLQASLPWAVGGTRRHSPLVQILEVSSYGLVLLQLEELTRQQAPIPTPTHNKHTLEQNARQHRTPHLVPHEYGRSHPRRRLGYMASQTWRGQGRCQARPLRWVQAH